MDVEDYQAMRRALADDPVNLAWQERMSALLAYTLLEQPAQEDLLPACVERRVGVVNVGVYNSGLPARATVPDGANYNYVPAPPEILYRARQLAAACAEFGVELPTAALQFSLRHPAVRTVVVGASNPTQIEQNVARMREAVPDELWKELMWRSLVPAM